MVKKQICGVSDGARTRDIPDHNRVLYQLSYAHHVFLKANDTVIISTCFLYLTYLPSLITSITAY